MGKPEAKPMREATYADIEALAPNLVGEILAGELVASPRPAPRHAKASTGLASMVGGNFGGFGSGPGGWCILLEPELHLGKDVVVPDLGGWRLERMPALPETAYFALAPDWVCEVLSDSTRRSDRMRKLPIYVRDRVAHVWLVDPVARTLEVYRLDGEGFRLVGTWGDTDKVRVEPFDAVELELSLLWS